MAKIICRCRAKLFDGLTWKGVSVAQFSMGYVNMKCRHCGFWVTAVNVKIFTGEIEEVYDYREGNNVASSK